jgi:hypothetical protein
VAEGGGPRGPVKVLPEHYALIASVGDQQFVWTLTETARGHLTGTYDLPIPPPATRGRVELARAPLTGSDNTWGTIASWDLHLESLSAASGREYVVLERVVRAQPRLPGSAQLFSDGYQITVRAQSGVVRGEVKIDLVVGGGRKALTPVAVRHLPAPRGVYNFCRWDFGPMALRPRPGTDEANCGG